MEELFIKVFSVIVFFWGIMNCIIVFKITQIYEWYLLAGKKKNND